MCVAGSGCPMVAFASTGGDLMGVQRDLIDDFLTWLGQHQQQIVALERVWDLTDPDDRQGLINEWARAGHAPG